MSKFYTVVAGDTFSIISRKQYGFESNEGLLVRSNPGANEPLTAGIQIIIPTDPNAPTDLIQSTDAADDDTVSILIDGKLFSTWTQARITQRLDSMDTATVIAPFEPDVAELRELFRPFSYKTIVIYVGDEPLFTGTMVNPLPITSPTSRTVTINAYSLPGVLNDCSDQPTEFNGQNLQTIAETLARPFGIGVEFGFDAVPGAVFDTVALSTGRNILDFLTELAKQRGLVINSSNRGTLRFWNSASTVQTDANFTEGVSPLTSVSTNFDAQRYYSHVVGIEPTRIDANGKGSKYTVKNPLLSTPYRPHFFDIPDAQAGTVAAVVDAKAARMFGNMVSYTASVATWRDSLGDLFESNILLNITAPGAMIYSPYNFLVRSVTFSATATTRSASLDLVIPGSFSSKLPESLPWDE